MVQPGQGSLALDLKDPRGLAVVRRLVVDADVFVQNLAHGAAARPGLDAATLCAAHPRLIAVDISGYGASGPYAGKRAYDMLVQCEAGLVSVTGTPEQPVVGGPGPVAGSGFTGGAAQGVAAALPPSRLRSNRGTPHRCRAATRRGWVRCPRSGSTPGRCCMPWG